MPLNHLVHVARTSSNLQVQCNYSDYFVCQYPLISTVQGTIVTINGTKVPDILSSVIRNWLTVESAIPRSLKIQVSFLHMVSIRYVFTAWTVAKITYKNQMTPSDNLTAQILNNPASPNGLPITQQLEHPVFANDIWIDLNIAAGQKSQYFELRGCDFEGV